MKHLLYAAGLGAACLASGAALAQAPSATLAPGATGIFATEDCGPTASYLILNETYGLHYDAREEDSVIAMGEIDWREDGLVILKEDYQLASYPSFSPADYATSCAALPGKAYVVFGEALALFLQVDRLRGVCENGPGGVCAAEIFTALDVSADQRLSPAELSRALRALAFFVAYEITLGKRASSQEASLYSDYNVAIRDLFSAATLTSIASPLVTASLMQSYDYDGDGFLSLKEILQDRGPLDRLGLEGRVEMENAQMLLQNAVTMAPALANMLAKGLLGEPRQ